MSTVQISYCNPPADQDRTSYCGNPWNLTFMEVQLPALKALQQVPSSPIPTLEPADVVTLFGVSFSIVVFFFLVGKGAGAVLSLIRGG